MLNKKYNFLIHFGLTLNHYQDFFIKKNEYNQFVINLCRYIQRVGIRYAVPKVEVIKTSNKKKGGIGHVRKKTNFKKWVDWSSGDAFCHTSVCEVYRIKGGWHSSLDLLDYWCYHRPSSIDSGSNPLLQLYRDGYNECPEEREEGGRGSGSSRFRACCREKVRLT